MLTKFFPIILALAIAIGALAELAFTSSKIYTVAGALKDADTAIVSVRGTVTPVGPNRYILTDTTGKCELQTCPTWFKEVQLNPGEQVVVTGELLKSSGINGSLYPLAVQSIKRDGRPDIVIREGLGRPPWASAGFQRYRSSSSQAAAP